MVDRSALTTVPMRRMIDVFAQKTAKVPRFELEALVSGTRESDADLPPRRIREQPQWTFAVFVTVLAVCVAVLGAAAFGVTVV